MALPLAKLSKFDLQLTSWSAAASCVPVCLQQLEMLRSTCGASSLALQVPGVYRRLHAKHHKKRVQRVTETLRLTMFEQAVDVACSIAAVNVTYAHPLSRTAYNMAIVWLINELHAGKLPSYVLFEHRRF